MLTCLNQHRAAMVEWLKPSVFRITATFSQSYPVYMMKRKVAFLEGRLFSIQSRLFENFSDCSDWLRDKSQFSK